MKVDNRIVKTVIACAALAFLLMPPASADVWDKKTDVTFSGSVEFPNGTVLAPGHYVMKLLNSASNRHIVQVYNQKQDHMYAMVMTIPAIRLEPAEKTIITFYEAPANEPLPIHTWFYPGDTVGQEFTYKKGRVRFAQTASIATEQQVVAQVSTQTNQSVTETESARVTLAQPPEIPAVETPRPVVTAPEVAQAPAEEPVLIAQATPQQIETRRTEETVPPADALPATASDVPYWAAASIVLLAGAFLTRIARRLHA